MLDTRLRKQIEWHFKNYRADLALYEERRRDVLQGNLTAAYERIGGRGSGISNPTESKAIRLDAIGAERNWATVVRNTFNAFRFEPEYDVMTALYIDKIPYKELIVSGLWERTFYRWRDEWLEYAYKWAKEFKLL